MNKYAILDIGSNSVRFAEEKGGALPDKEIYTTRLGAGLAATGRLSDGSMARSLTVIKALSERANADGFVPRAYATSAVRDAENGLEFAKRIEEECGVHVEIIDGRNEAKYAFLGASSGREVSAMIDVGGASMQIVTEETALSFRAGCVRCTEIAKSVTGSEDCDTDPWAQRAAVCEYLEKIAVFPMTCERGLVGVGGTITTLAALKAGSTKFEPAVAESVVLTPDLVEELIARLIEMGPARREHPLLKERHDVILSGAYVLAFALDRLSAQELFVSCKDGMEGYLYKVRNEGN